jgi:hypothetical protein
VIIFSEVERVPPFFLYSYNFKLYTLLGHL